MKSSKKKHFKDKPFEERKQMSRGVLNSNQDTIPIVLQPGKYMGDNIRDLKYNVQKKLKVLDLVTTFHMDKKLVQKQKGLYLFTSNKKQLLKNNQIIGDVYQKYKDDDGWLYLEYDTPPVF